MSLDLQWHMRKADLGTFYVAKLVWNHLNGCGESVERAVTLPYCRQWSCANLMRSLFGGSDPNSPFCPGWILNFFLCNFFSIWNLFWTGFLQAVWLFWGWFFFVVPPPPPPPSSRDSRAVSLCITRAFAEWCVKPLDEESCCATPLFSGKTSRLFDHVAIQFSHLLLLMEGSNLSFQEHSDWYRWCLMLTFIEKTAGCLADVTSAAYTAEWQRRCVDWKAAQALTKQQHFLIKSS